MKKDKHITLPLMVAVSAAMLSLTACSEEPDTASNSGWNTSEPTRVCVDDHQQRVDDSKCGQPSQAHASNGGNGAFWYWYYMSRGGYVPPVGQTVSGGSRTPMAAPESYRSASESYRGATTVERGGFGGGESVSRGGFGSSAHSFGGVGE